MGPRSSSSLQFRASMPNSRQLIQVRTHNDVENDRGMPLCCLALEWPDLILSRVLTAKRPTGGSDTCSALK
jgi:hypothetical protein